MTNVHCFQQSHNSIAPYIPPLASKDSTAVQDVRDNKNELNNCPPWHLPAENGTCKFGSSLSGVVRRTPNTGGTTLLYFNCMTTANHTGSKRDVVGECFLHTPFTASSMEFQLPTNISKLNSFMCSEYYRVGQLCGRCKDGYSLPVYSYSMKCIACKKSNVNWLKYLGVAFGPLTLFTIFVSLFHISPTSPYLHGFIMTAHLSCSPPILRAIVHFSEAESHYSTETLIYQMYFSLLGIWSLDFFRLVYKPFCIHPKLTVLQTLAMDYVTAVYPLLLVIATYILVKLHTRDCRLVVWAWKPFKYSVRILLKKLNIRTSLIDSFSTLFLLSTIKFQSVTFDLLIPIVVYYIDGTKREKLYLFMAGDVEYFGVEHLPYGILAIIVLLLTMILPTLLLFLYPCHCFHRCLNKFNCNSVVLQSFMDVFQGLYMNGTDNTRDFRYFSGGYFLLRIILIFIFYFNFHVSLFLAGILFLFLLFFLALFHPQISNIHYIIDCSFVTYLSLAGIILSCNVNIPNNMISHFSPIPTCIIAGGSFLPLVYFICLILFWILVKKKLAKYIFQRIKLIISSFKVLMHRRQMFNAAS